MLERVALAMASVLLVSNGVGAILLGPSRHSKIAAVVANIFTLAFYSAPLSAVGQIIRTKDASPLYPPMVVMSLVNGLLWTVYGLAIGEMGVALPNGIGAFLSLCQLALLLSFRKPHTPSTHKK
jgi:solute carrier family 50 protein (sugar transporter)